MFRNRRISFIVGASIGALVLVLQAVLMFGALGKSFADGVGLLQVACIFVIITTVITVATGTVGAVLIIKDKYSNIFNLYVRIFNVILVLPLIMTLLMLLGDILSITALMAESDPDVFKNALIVMSPLFYVALVASIAMPIASYVRIKKFKTEKQNSTDALAYNK